jgi:hypothetical protein
MAMKTWTNKFIFRQEVTDYRYIGTVPVLKFYTKVSPPTSIKMQIARVAKVVPVKIRFQQYITVKEVLLLQSLLYFVLN